MASSKDIKQNTIYHAEGSVSRMLKECAEHEDTYCACGLLYHKTSIITRRATGHQETRHARLKQAFEITTPSAYTALFASLTEVHQRLTELQSDMRRFLLPGPKTDEQYEAYQFPSRYQALCAEYAAVRKFFHKVKKEARWLSARNDGFVERDLAPGWKEAWATLLAGKPEGEYAPDIMAVEFYMLRQWVLCLPEVQRAVATGPREVDNIILNMLRLEDGDGFEDNEENGSEDGDDDVDMDEDSQDGDGDVDMTEGSHDGRPRPPRAIQLR
ncbi:hypothetical protein IQ07DRAFT_642682 [Pyrenochaeta sp. DS3sAY3a]|nr:hypothetical protein IQ07DRAFT_642682 [Pyrenochaeta sp. DS3sAY3a]